MFTGNIILYSISHRGSLGIFSIEKSLKYADVKGLPVLEDNCIFMLILLPQAYISILSNSYKQMFTNLCLFKDLGEFFLLMLKLLPLGVIFCIYFLSLYV